MGASKFVAEIYIQPLNSSPESGSNAYFIKRIKFIINRSGNILGSNSSVVSGFKLQIENGGAITVTHPEIKRYFMTITAAVQLVMETPEMSNGALL